MYGAPSILRMGLIDGESQVVTAEILIEQLGNFVVQLLGESGWISQN